MADVKMLWIEDDIKKIQTKTNLYIQEYNEEAAFHLFREVAQNSFDECEDPDSNGTMTDIVYDELTDITTIEDDGRGIPENDYPLDIFCTKIQSGSKFFRDQGGSSSGEFGVGLTAVNALSDYFSMTVNRDGYSHTITFERGEKVKDEKRPLKKGEKKHGTKTSFKASPAFLGKETKLPYEEVCDWLNKMSYLLKTNIVIKIAKYKGLELLDSKKYKSQPFDKLLDEIVKDTNYSYKAVFGANGSIDEEITKREMKKGKEVLVTKTVKKSIDLSVAFRYTGDNDTYIDSYCNYTNTTDGGIHVEAFDKTYCRYMINKVKETMTDAQKEKLPLVWDDVRMGLNLIINLSTDAMVRFEGNAKKRIGNKDLLPVLCDMVEDGLNTMFTSNPQILKDYINIIKANAKVRLDMNKLKQAAVKEKVNTFKEHMMTNYIRCNNTGKQWKEIFLVEGNSASGSARDGSDPDTQAFFLLRGVVKNAAKSDLLSIKENKEWRDFITVCRAGYGPSFDLKKLYFNRINIMTDQDVDGFGISAGILVFLFLYMRPAIEAGLVYKVYTPLYQIEDKNNEFVANKAEMTELHQNKIVKVYKIRTEAADNYMSKDELREFLTDTYDYETNLVLFAKYSGEINKYFIEAVTAVLVNMRVIWTEDGQAKSKDLEKTFNDQKFIKVFAGHLQKLFKETIMVPGSTVIKSVIDGKQYSIKISNRFVRKAIDLIPVYEKYGFKLFVSEKGGEERLMTISEFINNSKKYLAPIIHRFKGLGELEADQIHRTTLDINNRISVQYTIEDAEKDYKEFCKLFGGKKKDLQARKKMMDAYRIKREDLDN